MVVAFVDDHRDRFGVEPICRVLTEHGVKIAPNSYYAHKKRARSARAVRDEAVLAEIVRVQTDPEIGRGLYGVRKVRAALCRQGGVDGQPVSRRQVERLMRSAGLQGARRGRRFITTRPDPSAARPPDLVKRNFTAAEPNRLWVVDFTYVPTWSGMVFTAFVTDVFSRRIVGWRTAASMPTSLPLDALEMALWTRQRQGHTDPAGRLDGLIHHSDAGSQGGFKWSSQHLDLEVLDGQKAASCRSCAASEDAFAGQVGFPASGGARVLARNRRRSSDGRGRGEGRRVRGHRGSLVPRGWRYASDDAD